MADQIRASYDDANLDRQTQMPSRVMVALLCAKELRRERNLSVARGPGARHVAGPNALASTLRLVSAEVKQRCTEQPLPSSRSLPSTVNERRDPWPSSESLVRPDREEHDAIAREMGVETDPPTGLILHTAGETDGEWQIIEVWESAEAADRFEQERLRPALEKVMGGAPPEIGVPPTVYEADFVLRGK